MLVPFVSIVVVGENPLYTTTTNRLHGNFCFLVSVKFKLQTDGADSYKQ